MKDWKAIVRRCLFPPLWLLLVLTVCSVPALAAVFMKGWDTHPVGYAVYVLSFYTLTVDVTACAVTFPRYYRSIRRKVYENKYAGRYLTDAAFRTHVSLYVSLGINLLYVALNALSAVIYSTNWFGIFAVYYAIMAVMRFLLVRYVNRVGIGKDRLGELRRARACALILLALNLALSGAVLMMVYYDRGFAYQGMLIYAMALYTFWITAAAVRDLIRYRKYRSPVMSAAKMIKLAAAMVSMLSLETAMFAQFGGELTPETEQIMIMATGGGIAVIVTVMSVYTIVRSTAEIRQ